MNDALNALAGLTADDATTLPGVRWKNWYATGAQQDGAGRGVYLRVEDMAEYNYLLIGQVYGFGDGTNYGAEAWIKANYPTLSARVDFDVEQGQFYAYGDEADLRRMARLFVNAC